MENKTCPVCHQEMYPKEVKGIHIDVCDRHGIFLDKGELQHLADEFKKEGFSQGFSSSLKTLWRTDV